MPINMSTFDPEGRNANKVGLQNMLDKLQRELGGQGYFFKLSDEPLPGTDFYRVYIAQGQSAGYGGISDLYLDLRMGLGSPGGQVIEMSSSKPGTYGMPGFTRHIAGEQQLRTTVNTMADYVRSIYSFAGEKSKTPQEVAWTVYQTGSQAQGLPGAREWGQEEFDVSLYPKAGGVIGPSSLSGKRQFMAATVRYFIPNWSEEAKRDYVKQMTTAMATPAGGIPGLMGYGFEGAKWKSWVPLTTENVTRVNPQTGMMERVPRLLASNQWGYNEPDNAIFQARSPEGVAKSFTTWSGAREVADVPFVRNIETGRLERAPIIKPQRGAGIRYGWTQSSMIMPGEAQPNIVYSRMMGLVDQPNMPGATFASKGAFGGVEAIGEEGYAEYELGIKTLDQLETLITRGKLTFKDVQGIRVKGGRGAFPFATYTDEQGKRQKMFIEKSAYDVVLGKPTIHIPEFYDPNIVGREPSNFPTYNAQGEEVRTTGLIENLRKRFGDSVNIVGYSQKGGKQTVSGEPTGNPAELYVTIPTTRVTGSLGMKPEGMKSFISQLNQQLSFQLLGVQGETPVDFVSQEAKVPTRLLMSSFGVMNMQTQIDFINSFMPASDSGRAALIKYVQDSYTRKNRAVQISADRMAFLWEKATQEPMSADVLFQRAFKSILSISDPNVAQKIQSKFNIGLPITQMAGGTIYSQGGMEEMKRLIKEHRPQDQSAIEFVPYKMPSDVLDRLLSSTGQFTAEELRTPLYQMRYKVKQGQAVTMPVGAVFTPEYPSHSGYMGPKGIESIIANFPEISQALGLTSGGGKWLGPLESKAYGREGAPPKAVRGWNELFFWRPFQKRLLMGDKDVMLPYETVAMNTEIAELVKEASISAQEMPTDKSKMSAFIQNLKQINVERWGYPKGTDLSESFLLDPHSATLVPKASAIAAVESYGEGAEEGVTRTYMGQNYFRLVDAAAESVVSEPGSMIGVVGTARTAFYSRITNAFNPLGKRSKEIMRNVIGQRLPGTRGGRYQGLTQLETGEAYASDDYLRKMLANGKFASRKEIESILNYLDTGVDAYLPVLFQRFPDVSGSNVLVPLKLRSAKRLKSLGVEVPEGPTSTDLFFIGAGGNRISVGDYDGDPYMSLAVPITDLVPGGKPGKYIQTGVWRMKPQVEQEFENRWGQLFRKGGSGIDEAMLYMFGPAGTSTGHGSLDAERKNLSDYLQGVRNNRYNWSSRLEEVFPRSLKKALEATLATSGYKGGMAFSYNVRTMVRDIAVGALGMEGRSPKILEQAYERGAYTYQMYLDRLEEAQGGMTQLEETLNSFGIYGAMGEPGDVKYRLGFKVSKQGTPLEITSEKLKQNWPRAGGQGLLKTNYLLNMIAGRVAGMPEEQEADVMLAAGFAQPGGDQAILDALKNRPKRSSISTLNDRGEILKRMTETGEVGFNSPYYLMFAFRAVERFRRDYPEYADDKSVQIPWLDGRMKPLADIIKTKPYRMTKILNSLVIGSTQDLDPEDFEELKNLGATRIGALAGGVFSSYMATTGGVSPLSSKAEQEVTKQVLEAFKVFQADRIKSKPIIRASEIGTFGMPLERQQALEKQGWIPPWKGAQAESVYRVVLRTLGLESMMGQEAAPGVKLQKVDWSHFPEAIERGMSYEEKYKEAHPELSHIGKVDWNKTLSFRMGDMEIHGTPDFLGINPKTGALRIIDTKSPAGFSAGEMGAEEAKAHAMRYQYRMQLLTYAYGLEKSAQTMSEAEWVKFMGGWRIDKAKALEMRSAALGGMFEISIAPGRFSVEGGLEELSPIFIPFRDTERREYEEYTRGLRESVFTSKFFGQKAANLYSVLMSKDRLPEGLRGYTRTKEPVMPETIDILRQIGMQTGALTRAAGGGRFTKFQGKRIRVGEGGPEEIIVGKNGITIVPTSQLTESRVARGQYNPREGYAGRRMAEGGEEDYAYGFPGQSTGGGEPTAQSDEFIALQEQNRQMQERYSQLEQQFQAAQGQGPIWQQMVEGMGALTAAVREERQARGQPAKIIFQSTPKTPNPYQQEENLLSRLDIFKGSMETVEKYETDVRATLGPLLEEAGLGTELENIQGRPSAAQYLALAKQNLPRAKWMGALAQAGLTGSKRLRSVITAGRNYNKLIDIVQSAGGFAQVSGGAAFSEATMNELAELESYTMGELGEPTLRRNAAGRYVTEQGRFASREQVEASRRVQVSGAPTMVQATAVAETLQGLRNEPELAITRYGGATVKTLKELDTAMGRLVTATKNLEEAQIKGLDTEKEALEFRKAQLGVRGLRTQQEYETRLGISRTRAPELYEGGKYVGFEKAAALREQGVITPEEEEYARQTEWTRQQGEGQQATAELAGRARMGMMAKVGGFARRMLGGFGLMYLRSMMGFITGPAEAGFAEAEQAQVMATNVLGGGMGGFAPTLTPDQRIQRARLLQGGFAGWALRGMQANVAENPALSGGIAAGQAALGAGALSLYLTSLIPGAGAAAGPVGLIAAGLAATGVTAAGISGAMQQPYQAAASLFAQGRISTSPFNAPAAAYTLQNVFGGGRGENVPWALRQMEEMNWWMQNAPQLSMKQIPTLQGLTREQYAQLVPAYAQGLATQYNVQPEYTYQAVRMKEMYNIPITPEKGGGLENLAIGLQQGIPVQQLAGLVSVGLGPQATEAQRAQFIAQQIKAWTAPGGAGFPTDLQQQYIQQGAAFYQQLGRLAPTLTPETTTVYKTVPIMGQRDTSTLFWEGAGGYGETGFKGLIGGLINAFENKGKEVVTGYTSVGEEVTEGLEDTIAKFGSDLNETQKQILVQYERLQEAAQARGQPYQPITEAMIGKVAEMSPEEQDIAIRLNRAKAAISGVLDSIADTFTQLGQMLPDLSQLSGMTGGQLAVVQQGAQFGMQLNQQMLMGGASPTMAQAAGGTFAQIATQRPDLLKMYQGVMQFNPQQWAAYAMQNPAAMQQLMTGGAGGGPMTVRGLGGQEISLGNMQFAVGVTAPFAQGGQMTGLPWARTSLATFNQTSAATAMQLWGTTGTPGSLIEALTQGGTRGGERWQQERVFEQQRAQIGLQYEQIALQKWYQPQQFALQQQGMQLGWEQQTWNIQQQRAGLALSRENFAATTGFQQQQMGMQRGWQQQDWAYQGQVRGMQWGWRQEDFQEQVRFMTGRERRLAERQMGRETIMYGMEGEQIDKQKSRQKELWQLEDERFAQQVGYQEKLFEMQEDSIDKQEEFFLKRKELEQQQFDLSVEYWNRSIALQEKQIGIGAAYEAQQEETFNIMKPLNNKIEDVNGQLSLFNETSMVDMYNNLVKVDPLFKSFAVDSMNALVETAEPAAAALSIFTGDMVTLGSTLETTTPLFQTFVPLFITTLDKIVEAAHGLGIADDHRRQHGGRAYPGEVYWVGERGPEPFIPDVAGTIRANDPWDNTIVTTANATEGAPRVIHLVINLGNERLIDRVLDAVDVEINE